MKIRIIVIVFIKVEAQIGFHTFPHELVITIGDDARLPSGEIQERETLEEAASRILREATEVDLPPYFVYAGNRQGGDGLEIFMTTGGFNASGSMLDNDPWPVFIREWKITSRSTDHRHLTQPELVHEDFRPIVNKIFDNQPGKKSLRSIQEGYWRWQLIY